MARDSGKARNPGRRLQGDFILSAARSLYFYGACIAFLAIIAGIVVTLYFQYAIFRPASRVPVPPAYVSERVTVDLEGLSDYLAPPKNLRFVVVTEYVDHALKGDEAFGYFDADTPNGLAKFPNDFEFVGGADAALFERLSRGYRVTNTKRRSGLRPSAVLAAEINGILPSLTTRQSRTFELRVIARDSYGNLSVPANVNFVLEYGPPVSPTDVPSDDPVPTEVELTELELLARDIALIVDPNKTPDYFEAYGRANKVPQQCGARTNDTVFVSNFRRAFNKVRSSLNASNIEAFYAGVCNAWKKFEDDENLARSQADAERNSAIEENDRMLALEGVKKYAARAARPFAWSAAVGGLFVFMIITLFLAFLAIENHSRAIRRAVEVLAQKNRS